MHKNSRLVHDCPILEHPIITGFSYDDWVIDILHGWVLGPISGVVASTITFCVKSGVFTPASIYLDRDDRDRLAMLHIKSLVSLHYEHKKQTDPSWKVSGTEVSLTRPHSASEGFATPNQALQDLLWPFKVIGPHRALNIAFQSV
jgi:hypothetical protein